MKFASKYFGGNMPPVTSDTCEWLAGAGGEQPPVMEALDSLTLHGVGSSVLS